MHQRSSAAIAWVFSGVLAGCRGWSGFGFHADGPEIPRLRQVDGVYVGGPGGVRLRPLVRPTDAEVGRIARSLGRRRVRLLEVEGAIVNDYAGDGMLAFFEGEGRGQRALRAARGMLESLEMLNHRRAGREPLRLGIALHAGKVLVGTIGAPSRRQYTIVGDPVNVTDRLEKQNKELGSVLIASAAALHGIDAEGLGLRGPVSLAVRGREEPIAVHYLPG